MKQNIKNEFKKFIRIIAFLTAFLILTQFLSITLFSAKSAAGFSNKLQDAYSFVNEPNNTVQIACIGNSDLYSGFSPLDLWKSTGYTSTVCASARQSIKQSQQLLEKVCKNQKPQAVIIETDMLYDANPKEGKKAKIKSNGISSFFDSLKPEFFENDINNIFSVFQFHNKWKNQSSSASKELQTHGYRYNNKVFKITKTDYMAPTNEREEISKANLKQFAKLMAFCQKENLKVLLVEMPSPSSWNSARHNAVADLAKEYNTDFIDLNLEYDQMNISMENCFRDKGNHLNYAGAKAATEYIGKFIKEKYNLQTPADKAVYDYWNTGYLAFVKSTGKSENA